MTDADLSTFVLQPDLALPADGEFDLFANVNTPYLLQNFSVDFTYTGSAAPGSQTFALYGDTFDLVQSGSTKLISVPAQTPEPASGLLTTTGALMAWAALRRRFRA